MDGWMDGWMDGRMDGWIDLFLSFTDKFITRNLGAGNICM
jgi:hypothetical protein